MSLVLSDFDSLMDLAEEVAKGIDSLRGRLGRLSFLLISSAVLLIGATVALAAAIAFRRDLIGYAFTFLLTAGALGSVFAPLGAFWALRERRLTVEKLESEHRIMDEVAGTAAKLFERIDPELAGVVPHTVAQLRLRRLSLGEY